MKFLDVSVIQKLNSSALSLTYCWLVERTDGLIKGFTSFDSDLIIDGVTYAARTGFLPSATELNNRLEVSNLTINSFLDDDSITEVDLVTGLWDYARLKVFLADPTDLPPDLTTDPSKAITLIEGTLGKVTSTDRGFVIEVRSLVQHLNQKSSWVTSDFCRYDFCDSLCGLNAEDFTDSLTVSGISENKVITVADPLPDDKYRYGVLTFTSGAAAGKSYGLANSGSNTLTLFEPCPFEIQVGDTFEALQGCDKSRADCKGFGNIDNFGGEPDVPGIDEYLAGYRD